jgi:hypothetical protein
MRRYYALQLIYPGKIQLIKALDGESVLMEAVFPWQFGGTYAMTLAFLGSQIQAWVDQKLLFTFIDANLPLESGAVALLCTEGRTATQQVSVRPV